jgi:hypothetical protein
MQREQSRLSFCVPHWVGRVNAAVAGRVITRGDDIRAIAACDVYDSRNLLTRFTMTRWAYLSLFIDLAQVQPMEANDS